MFAWLVTMVLHESPQMVGIAQMTMLVPTMLLILVGGSLADVIGGRRIVLIAQGVAVLPPLLLCVAAWTGNLTFKAMLLYAVTMGLAQAFVTPARDGLLNHVAEGGIQSAVVRASVMQFGVQIAGLAIASFAENVGPGPILLVQAIVLAIGVRFFSQIPDRLAGTGPVQRPWRDLGRSIAEGYRTIAASPSMRMTLLMSCAMGTCFMGSYIVTLPLLVREYYAGSAQDLALMNAANSIGLVTTIVILMRFGDIRRQGRALLIAQGIGALMLGSIGIGVSFTMSAGARLYMGNGRRHRDEYVAHDHAGAGARRSAQPRHELLFVRVHGFGPDRRFAERFCRAVDGCTRRPRTCGGNDVRGGCGDRVSLDVVAPRPDAARRSGQQRGDRTVGIGFRWKHVGADERRQQGHRFGRHRATPNVHTMAPRARFVGEFGIHRRSQARRDSQTPHTLLTFDPVGGEGRRVSSSVPPTTGRARCVRRGA